MQLALQAGEAGTGHSQRPIKKVTRCRAVVRKGTVVG
jgi:hypothetical protein